MLAAAAERPSVRPGGSDRVSTRVHPDMQSTGICNVGLGLYTFLFLLRAHYRALHAPIIYKYIICSISCSNEWEYYGITVFLALSAYYFMKKLPLLLLPFLLLLSHLLYLFRLVRLFRLFYGHGHGYVYLAAVLRLLVEVIRLFPAVVVLGM